MKLRQRFPYANEYDTGKISVRGLPITRMVEGGTPNVPYDKHGNLRPLNNELKVITSNPHAKYVLKQGPFFIGFHDRANNKYGTAIRLRTGETLIKRAINDPICTPTVIDNRILQWKYGNDSWIREYATEKEIKEVIHQKAGQTIKFKYRLTGLTVKKVGNQVDFYRGDKKAFSILRPYYCTAGGEFISYVPVTWQKVSGNWEVTYPAPTSDCYIDPTIEFSERGGAAIGGDHKDTWIDQTGVLAQSYGGDVTMWTGNFANDAYVIGRFSLVGHIPTNAIINTAVGTFTKQNAAGGALATTLTLHNLLTNWGVTNIDEGISQNPAAQGQGTWDNAFDFNGVGDVGWNAGVGVGFGAGDIVAATDIINVNQNEVAGTLYNLNFAAIVRLWVPNDAGNFGYAMFCNAAYWIALHSQEAVVPANRPYLTVDYDIPIVPPPPAPTGRNQPVEQYKKFWRGF